MINPNIVTDMDVFNVNVKIQIGVTDELFKLLQPVVSGLTKPQVENEKPAVEDKKPKSGNEKKAEEDKKPQVENGKYAARTEEKPEVKEEQPVEQAKESHNEVAKVKEETTEEKIEYTEVDVRAAMDATRKRIEGEDYKMNAESEGRKNWHRKLTAWFKNTAAVLGADKPSELPDSASRKAFITCCERVTIENNELIENVPF